MKYIAGFFPLFFACGAALAGDGEFLIGAADCRVVNPAPQAGESITWSGPCRDGYAQGLGVLQWYLQEKPGSRYEGTLEKGRAHGTGVYDYKDDHGRYEGEFKHGKRHGKGKMSTPESTLVATYADGHPVGVVEITYTSGRRYRGELKNDEAEGKGQLRYASGFEYDGDFKQGKREGRGVLVEPNGDRYEGGWKADRFDGQGKLVRGDGSSYDGTWKDGKADGAGRKVYKDGARYEGEFKGGKREGRGVLSQKNGDRYEGAWAADQFNGDGVYAKDNGQRHEGTWVKGKLEGQGHLIFTNGARYDGAFKSTVQHGHGVYVGRQGNRYEGEWKDGKQDGVGSMVYMAGGRYDGAWKDGAYDGEGTLVLAGGKRYQGMFKNGLALGSAAGPAPKLPDPATPELPDEVVRVPPRKSYAELTAAEKKQVRASYVLLDDGDEPPYPLKGPRAMYAAVAKALPLLNVGEVFLYVDVDSEGIGTEVRILRSPGPATTAFLSAWLLTEQKYKPALCAGQPCAMAMPVRLSLTMD